MPSAVTFILFCLLSIHFLSQTHAQTCHPGNLPEPNTYSIHKIGRYCPQWDGKLSCCSQKELDVNFWDDRENFENRKVCGIRTDFESDCEMAKWGIRCFTLCATIEEQEQLHYVNGTTTRFSLCHNLARHIYLRCRSYMFCDGGQCEDDEDSLDGCVAYKDRYSLQEFTEEVLGYHYDNTPDSTSCFSSASSVRRSWILGALLLGFAALSGL